MERALSRVRFFYFRPMIYLILALATWRLSNLLVNEDGPWSMFARLRAFMGVRYNSEMFQTEAANILAGVFICIWCMSVWVGLFWWAIAKLWPDLAMWGAVPLALSAGTILMDKVTNGRDD